MDKLPPAILKHGKIGFDIPAHDWLRGPLRPMLEDTLREGVRDYGDVFRGDVINDLAKRHTARQINAGYQLWGLLILFQWMRKWKIQAAATPQAEAFERASVGPLV
jgi:asparagine synthase (glutamine-hydrolysing)